MGSKGAMMWLTSNANASLGLVQDWFQCSGRLCGKLSSMGFLLTKWSSRELVHCLKAEETKMVSGINTALSLTKEEYRIFCNGCNFPSGQVGTGIAPHWRRSLVKHTPYVCG